VNAVPQLPGYELDQRMLEHPLAEIWRGRSFTGMEIVALVLSDAGAANEDVRDRLDRASRGAALEPEQQQTPLWAANFTTARPYAITQLVPGQSGAERLLDPLDGVLGNDEVSLNAVRSQLAQYGAAPLPPGELPWALATSEPPAPDNVPAGKFAIADEYHRRFGGKIYLAIIGAVLIVFTVTYSLGGAIGSAVKDPQPAITQGPAPALASPGPLPTPAVQPGVVKAQTAPYNPRAHRVALVGATYRRGADIQVADQLDLPFAFGWPRPPLTKDLGESSYAIYRRVLTSTKPATSAVDARIAVHPCRDLAGCLAERTAFDKHWTTYFKTEVPKTAKEDNTWITERPAANKQPYVLTMTHAFQSGDRWWLAGVVVTGLPGQERPAQRVLNDIRSQTP
jgi:hypothetical protein